MKKILSLFLCTILSLSMLTACKAQKTQEKFTGTIWDSFDTIISIVSFQDSQEDFDKFMDFANSEYARLDKLYDIYNNYPDLNNAKTINDNAGIQPVKVEEDLFNLIKFSVDTYSKTKGKVNIGMGSVLKIWHDVRENSEFEEPVLPTMEELEKANQHTSIDNIVLDEENMTVYITDPKASIDLGSIAKGYATELIADKLAQMTDNFIISAGGNVKTHGAPKDGRTRWGVGIQNPAVNENFEMIGGNIDLAYVAQEKSVVCSGGYQRFFVVDGQRYHHLIDPVTLFPLNYYQGVAILCEDSGMADALSTAIFMMEADEAIEFINSIPDVECMLILQDGTQQLTKGFEPYLQSYGITSKTPLE